MSFPIGGEPVQGELYAIAMQMNAASGGSRQQAQDIVDKKSQCSSVLSEVSNTLQDDTFYAALLKQVRVYNTSTKRKNAITAEQLATTWNIGIEAAKKTIRSTTQQGINLVANLDIAQKFTTNDCQLRYRRLRTTLFSDTYFDASVKSRNGNSCAQIFCDNTGWTRTNPMLSKAQAHGALSLLFSRDGAPDTLVVDGAQKQVKRQFKKKSREADCHIRQTEPYSPWSNAAKGAIHELKKGIARKMLQSKAPKRLWDHCAQLEAKIRSHTANTSLILNGQVPETHVTGSTADISTITEYKWYLWVYFKDEIQSFPDLPFILGRQSNLRTATYSYHLSQPKHAMLSPNSRTSSNQPHSQQYHSLHKFQGCLPSPLHLFQGCQAGPIHHFQGCNYRPLPFLPTSQQPTPLPRR
jgi:hypothetical protein